MKLWIIIPTRLEETDLGDLPSARGLALTRRALSSLETIRDRDFGLILPFSVPWPEGGPNVEAAWELDEGLRSHLAPLTGGRPAYFLTDHGFTRLKSAESLSAHQTLLSGMGLNGFGRIRNAGLLIALLAGAEAVLFLDNDVVVEDPELVGRLKQRFIKRPGLGGLAGVYVNQDQGLYVAESRGFRRWVWDKAGPMNQSFAALSKAVDLVDCPTVFGGNIALTRPLFSAAPFDPFLPRGEDMDLRIAAMQAGFLILVDPAQKVLHAPGPRGPEYAINELTGDVVRFIYQRGKARGVPPARLAPYPGAFLKADIRLRAAAALMHFAAAALLKRDPAAFRRAVSALPSTWKNYRRQLAAYGELQRRWAALAGDLPPGGLPEAVAHLQVREW